MEINGETLTYSQLICLVETRVNQISSLIKQGQTRVALCIPEGIEIPINVLALNYLNVTVIPLNPTLQVDQINHLLASVDADLLITYLTKSQLFDKARTDFQIVELEALNSQVEGKRSLYLNTDTSSNYDEFLITLSSGSTGSPKPIVLSEKNKLDRFKQAVQLYDVNSDDVILCASPFFHSLGQRLTFLPLLAGATLVQLTRFTARNWCETVVDHGVTFTIPVSSHLHELVEPLLTMPHRFSSLRCLVSSSAVINDDVKEKLFDTLSCEFHEMYGASEIATATNLNREQAVLKPKSVGVPCPGVEVMVVDEDLELCKPMEMGQIIVQSPLVSAGYYNLSDTTEESFTEGYFLTGDLGYFDDDGYLYFVDRKKDIIISGGMNIYPSDIEEIIKEHKLVNDCVVIGIYDNYLGEIPVAVLVCDENRKMLEKEIRTMVKKRLAAFQHPAKYFQRNNLPLTASGKVDRKSLREELNDLKFDLSSKLRALQNIQS